MYSIFLKGANKRFEELIRIKKESRLLTDVIFKGSLPFCVARNEGEDPGIAAATVEGLAFSRQRRALRFSTGDINPPFPPWNSRWEGRSASLGVGGKPARKKPASEDV